MNLNSKPRLKKGGMLWVCRAPFGQGHGVGLTPAEAYKNWLLDAQRPVLQQGELRRLVPFQEPMREWPVYHLPLFGPGVPSHRLTGAEPWTPPYTITCQH